MEAFEQFVALAMEEEGLVVSGALKFPVRRRTRKELHPETQTHGYEVDLVGARSDRLVLASVKSYFGSRGVVASHVAGTDPKWSSRYALLNQPTVRDEVVSGAMGRFGFSLGQVEMRLYVGRFAPAGHEERVREWCAEQRVGHGPIRVIGAAEVVEKVRRVAARSEYRDNAVLATLKVLEAAGAFGGS